MSDKIERQLDAVIALLARSDGGLDRIRDIVIRGKRNPRAYIKTYNALDGSVSVTDAARIAGVSQPTMTTVLKGWEAEGIVYDVGEPRKPCYRKLASLSNALSHG